MLRVRGALKRGDDIVRAAWRALPSPMKVGLLGWGLTDPGDVSLGQIAWLAPMARAVGRRSADARCH